MDPVLWILTITRDSPAEACDLPMRCLSAFRMLFSKRLQRNGTDPDGMSVWSFMEALVPYRDVSILLVCAFKTLPGPGSSVSRGIGLHSPGYHRRYFEVINEWVFTVLLSTIGSTRLAKSR